jgi:hypothetical protein
VACSARPHQHTNLLAIHAPLESSPALRSRGAEANESDAIDFDGLFDGVSVGDGWPHATATLSAAPCAIETRAWNLARDSKPMGTCPGPSRWSDDDDS